MPIRITGMNSGLDTESIITALTQRHKDKVDTHTGNQKKLSWKQDKWKDLNKKAVSFYNGTLSNMRFSTAYTKKTTVASNSSAVSVVTGDAAMDATQTLSITSLSKAAYLTGEQVKTPGENGEKAKKTTTMTELGMEDGGTLKFKIGGDSADYIEVNFTGSENISDVLDKLKSAESKLTKTKLNFNFDENNARFYVSSKTPGASASFDLMDEDSTSMKTLGFTKKSDGSNYIAGTKAAITLNGVNYESDSNTFEINGLTITANEVASNITLTTKQDTSGIYDNIKKMLKEYNEMMKEFATAFNADKATKYKMLTDDQKDEMSEKEIEEWEKKIKEGLLSGDETLSNIRSSMKTAMLAGFEVTNKNGETVKMSLANFGIATGSYFNTEENERDMFHIDGDSEDTTTSGNTDLLKAAISSDPDMVQSFFSQLAKSVYSKMSDLMQRTEYSSAYTIYEDKMMASQYTSYTSKIDSAQKALEAAQDRYYSKFSKMETALAKINSNSGSLSSFFGGG